MDIGAFANLIRALADGITQAGAGPVDLLYLGPRSAPDASDLPPGVRLVPLPARRSIAAIPALMSYLRSSRPRVLVTMPTVITVPALVAFRMSSPAVRGATAFVIYQGDTLGNDVRIDHARSPRLRALPVLARLTYPWADAMVACAPGVVELLRKDRIMLPGGRATIIPNPVDVESYRSRGRCEPASHPWLEDKTGPVITTLGRLVPRKNQVLLLQALADVRLRGCDARLIVLGEGPERERLRSMALELGVLESVSFPGFVENPHAEIARSDLFVMSSNDEAFCLALVEAMACGIPVVSTDAVGGGPRSILHTNSDEIAPEERSALQAALVPCGDRAALTEAMQRCIMEPEFGRLQARAVRRRAEAFSPTAVGAQWAVYLKLLEAETPQPAPPTRRGQEHAQP